MEQVHRIVNKIDQTLHGKEYCSAAFLDIAQAFDKVWHEGLLYKIKLNLPYQYYQIIRSYLEFRHFYVRHNDAQTKLCPIGSGVPQGSVIGPTLYLLYTADLPTSNKTTLATFADDTTIIAFNQNPETASRHLQEHLNE